MGCRIDDLDDPRSELPVGCLGWPKLGCLGWAKLGCLGWLKLGCLGWAKLGCLSWLKLGVSTVGLWGVSQLEDGPQRGVRGGVFGGCVSTYVATCALGIAPSEPVNPLPYCGFGHRNP